MTEEFHFGQFTHAEMQEHIDRAVEQERERSAAAILVWMLVSYAVGLICGALAL